MDKKLTTKEEMALENEFADLYSLPSAIVILESNNQELKVAYESYLACFYRPSTVSYFPFVWRGYEVSTL